MDNLESVTDAEGNATTYAYDDFGGARTTTSPVTGITIMDYDKAGNLIDTLHPSGRHEVIAYDDANRRTSQIDTLAAETEHQHQHQCQDGPSRLYDILGRGY